MRTKTALIDAALEVLEEHGEAGFSTRAVLRSARVTAPTLYHYYGTIDGLLGTAVTQALGEFLADREPRADDSDPLVALRQAFDDLLAFAAAHPNLFGATLIRLLQGVTISAAELALASLAGPVNQLAEADRLAMPAQAATDLIVASAHGAASLYLMDSDEKPDLAVIEAMRDNAIETICAPGK